MGQFTREPDHWLRKLTPDEWIRAAMAELRRAEAAYAGGDGRGGSAGVKRAAGMALNAALIVEPDEKWGRSYVEHVKALARGRCPRKAPRTVRGVPPGAPRASKGRAESW